MSYESLLGACHTGRAAKRIRCRKPNSQAALRPPGFVVVSSATRGNTNCPRSSVTPSPTRAKRGVPRWDLWVGGEGGIRTHDTLARIPVFETGTFNRSVTSPVGRILPARRFNAPVRRPLEEPCKTAVPGEYPRHRLPVDSSP